MISKKRLYLLSTFLILSTLFLFLGNILWGSVDIPISESINILLGGESQKKSWAHIILESRLPQAITALFTGGALAVSGLLLQTIFRNPLADAGILGISAGASLGVALVMLLIGGVASTFTLHLSSALAVVLGAFIGAITVLFLIMFFSTIIKNNMMLLIIGIMIGYLTSSLITLLKYWSTSENAYSYMIWGMGNFSGVSNVQLPFYCITITVGLFIAITLMKPLNALLLGDNYAINLGVNIKVVRFLLLFSAGLLTAVTTAFCGPISFLGIAIPHIARLLLGTSNHNSLLPFSILLGTFVALLCNLFSTLPSSVGVIPLNAITPLIGAPVIIYVIVNQKKIQYFN